MQRRQQRMLEALRSDFPFKYAVSSLDPVHYGDNIVVFPLRNLLSHIRSALHTAIDVCKAPCRAVLQRIESPLH
jgi:hypothetical protein